MYVYKYNPFNKKYYKYCADEYDAHESKFDEKLHVNECDPMEMPRTQCAYCGCMFDSRNKLFNHLGFMGIDTRKDWHGDISRDGDIEDNGGDGDEYNSEMGDFGFGVGSEMPAYSKVRLTKRRRRWSKNPRYKRRQIRKLIAKKRDMADISIQMKCMKLNASSRG